MHVGRIATDDIAAKLRNTSAAKFGEQVPPALPYPARAILQLYCPKNVSSRMHVRHQPRLARLIGRAAEEWQFVHVQRIRCCQVSLAMDP